MVSPELALKVQRVIDEYVGAVGSAAIVTRSGEVLFHSEHDDSACGLARAANHVPVPDDIEPAVVNLPASASSCSYGVALDAGYVLMVATMPGVSASAITTRMKKAAHLLRRVLRAGVASPPPMGGASGAAARVARHR